MSRHAEEVAARQRFEFGKNWSSFLSVLDEERIVAAETSLKAMLACESLEAWCRGPFRRDSSQGRLLAELFLDETRDLPNLPDVPLLL